MPLVNKDNNQPLAPSQEDQNEPELQQTDSQEPFNMSEMLHYKPEEKSVEQIASEQPGLDEQYNSQTSNVPQPETADHVAIHDDLAISDSDEDDNNPDEPQKKEDSENENDEDGDGLWF